jgi:hypothetical protein
VINYEEVFPIPNCPSHLTDQFREPRIQS